MATVKQFEDLNVWQEARQLVCAVYAASRARAFQHLNLSEAREKEMAHAVASLQPATCFVETIPKKNKCPLTPALSPEGERGCEAWMPRVNLVETMFSTEQPATSNLQP
jgi:hypothetical protein